MALSYTYGGFEPATAHQNVRKAWDTLLHEQVIATSQFKGLIGADKGGEGADKRLANFPIITKTQLGKEQGDLVRMGLVTSNITAATWYNDGKSGSTQLVDNEASLTLYNLNVRIAHQRFGIAIDGKMTLKRTPYDLQSAAKDNIAQLMTSFLDSSIFFTLYSGYSPNVLREYGVTTADPTAHPNNIFGNAQSALTGITAADTLDTEMLEILRVFLVSQKINPIKVDGGNHWILFIAPRNGKTLRADTAWVDANVMGMPRGESNPVFQNQIGQWAGIVVKEVEDTTKVSSAKNYNGLTVAADAITLADDTVGGGVTATDIFMCPVLGANAVARAYGLESYMAVRKEDDFGNIYGVAGGFIGGDRRADFALSADTGTDGAVKNQSSAILYAHGGDSLSNLPTVW